MKSPAYGWLTGLTDYLNANFPDKWAYSGSFAMYCHAAAKNKETCREPGDIDIVTSSVASVWMSVRKALDGTQACPPGPKTKKATIEGAKLYVNGRDEKVVKIDVLVEGGTYGKLSEVVIYRQSSTTLRVMSVTALLRSKGLIVDDGDDDDGKAAGDIIFLKDLQ